MEPRSDSKANVDDATGCTDWGIAGPSTLRFSLETTSVVITGLAECAELIMERKKMILNANQ
jgi:hypothetical protein